METIDIITLGARLVQEHLDSKWIFKLDNAKRRFGMCNHSQKIISVSKPMAMLNEEKDIRIVILHEIAHALVGCGHGHDLVWRAKCIELGGDGEQYYNPNKVVQPTQRYVLTCPKCGHSFSKARVQMGRKRACFTCCHKYNGGKFHDAYSLTITDTKNKEVTKYNSLTEVKPPIKKKQTKIHTIHIDKIKVDVNERELKVLKAIANKTDFQSSIQVTGLNVNQVNGHLSVLRRKELVLVNKKDYSLTCDIEVQVRDLTDKLGV